MSKFIPKALVLAAVIASFGASAQITNGSFELPDIVGNPDSPPQAITGWNTVGGVVQLVDSAFATPGFTLTASNLLQWVDLSGPTGTGFNKGVWQAFVGSSGTAYTLSFDVGRLLTNAYGPAHVEVFDGLTSLGTFSNTTLATGVQSMNWVSHSTTFVSAGSNVLSFLAVAPSGGLSDQIVGLDNVSVTAVPEPGTYAMLLAGLTAVGFVAKRRRA